MSVLNEQLLKQCWHRHRSLEVELAESARSGLLTEADFNFRVRRLDTLRKHLESMEARSLSAQEVPRIDQGTLELPILSNCSKVEQKIILATLAETARMLEEIAADTEKLLGIARDAHADRLGWFKAMMKLSWMRSRILWAGRQSDLVKSARRVLEDFILKFSPSRQNPHGQGDLVEAFREFEAATSRVASLNTKLHREMALNRDQEVYLRNYEARRQIQAEKCSPPVPAELNRVKFEVEEKICLGSTKAQERLTIAMQLADSLTTSSREKFRVKEQISAHDSNPVRVPLHRPTAGGKKAEKRRASGKGVRP